MTVTVTPEEFDLDIELEIAPDRATRVTAQVGEPGDGPSAD